jgi:hypothetical protein
MAKKSKTVPANKPAIDLAKLGEIVKATLSGGFVYMSAAEVAPLVTAELVETNPAMTDEHGAIATRSTTKGNETVNTEATNAPAATAAETPKAPRPSPASFEIDNDVAIPTIKRGGGRGGNLYPFDNLAVGGSFHVAATDAKPNPAKSLASTVSSATKRYEAAKRSDGTPDVRKFIVRSVDASDKRGAGARVFRTE